MPGTAKQWTTKDLIALGQQHVSIGQYNAALQIATAANEDDEYRHAAFDLIGDAYAGQGNLDEAQFYYSAALDHAVRSGSFEAKLHYLKKIEKICCEQSPQPGGVPPRVAAGVGGPVDSGTGAAGTGEGNSLRLKINREVNKGAYRIVRNVLRRYGYYDVLASLFDKIPAEENEFSRHRADTAAWRDRAIDRGMPSVCINTLPKSGTRFLVNTFSTALDAPGVGLSVGLFPEDRVVPSWARFFCKGGCVSAQHMNGSLRNLRALHDCGLRKIWVHVRDPRQALLSFYHHVNAGDPAVAAEMDEAYYTLTAEEKIARHIKNGLPNAVRWLVSWKQAAESDEHGLEIFVSRHEDLARDVSAFFDRACAFYNVDRQLFGNQLIGKREYGALHFRKGETDEWRSIFSEQHKAAMNEVVTDELLDYFGWQR